MFTGTESRRQISLEEDDDMLQYAITQSLLESGTEEDQVSSETYTRTICKVSPQLAASTCVKGAQNQSETSFYNDKKICKFMKL